MKIVILHLSDIHFTSMSDPIIAHADLICSAISPISVTNPDGCLVVISGDIANKATVSEYKIAKDFISSIKTTLNQRYPGIIIHVVLIPGNHDCYFGEDQSVRDVLLDKVVGNPESSPGPGIVKGLIAPLRHFDEFALSAGAIKLSLDSTPLLTIDQVSFGNYSIQLILLNSPWISRIKEEIGTHYFPTSVLDEVKPIDTLTISVMHHHPSWFNPAQRRNLTNFIDATSDLFITGHEHQSAIYRRSRIDEELSVIHVEGGVLQDESAIKNSSFNIVLIDTDELRLLFHSMRFHDGRYRSTNDNTNWQRLSRSSRQVAQKLPFTSQWDRDLDDLGTRFTHRYKDLRLSDLYVPPNLRERRLDRKTVDDLSSVVSADQLPQYIAQNKNAVVIGEEASGKTSLIKYWTTVLKRQGLYPLIVKGEEITSTNDDNVFKLIKRALDYQYGNVGADRFLSLASNQRVVLIDDFHRSPLNYSSKDKFLTYLEKFADHILIFSDEMWELTDWSVSTGLRDHLSKYATVEIMPFGHQHRERLIRNWLTAGNLENLSEEELVQRTDEHKQMIDVLLGRNLLPLYPFFILAYLQQMEAGAPVHSVVGSHGYLYASLINRSLAEVVRDTGIDTETYLSMLAAEMLVTDVFRLSPSRVSEIHEEYCRIYHLPISRDKLLSTLKGGGLLDEDAVGISFKYRYIYYYFAAKYLSNHIDDFEIKNRVEKLVDSLYKEDSGNIVIFLSYLSSGPYILQLVLAKARALYPGIKPCDFDKDVAFVSALQSQIPAVVLEQKSLIEARDELNKARDEIEQRNYAVERKLETEQAKTELQEILELNQALKTIQILGQILRNSMGSLVKAPKYDAAEAVYLLGLRTINAYLFLLNKHLGQIVGYVENLIDSKITDKGKRAARAREIVAWLTELFGVAVIKRLAQAIGHEQLKLTFQDVLEKNRSIAVEVIDLAIKLDHYKVFPEKELNTLIEKTSRNVLARVVIRNLSLMRFYLLPTPFDMKEKFCAKLGIKIEKARQIEWKKREEKK